MRERQNKIKKDSELARFLTDKINAHCDSTDHDQVDLAYAMGYKNANNITMIKQGLTKLPIPKAPALARALNMEPADLIAMAMKEYTPDVFEALHQSGVLPDNALELFTQKAIREALNEFKPARKIARDIDLEEKIKQVVKEHFN